MREATLQPRTHYGTGFEVFVKVSEVAAAAAPI
jgi:hypothetical protein